MHPVELQQRIDRELKSLPGLRAPETLLPRVLAAVRHWADRPWYARAWFTWPMWWRVVSAAALLAVLAGVGVALPVVQDSVAARTAGVHLPVSVDVAAVAKRVVVMASALQTLWVAIAGPFVAYAFLLLVLMGLLCAACAAALNRVAFGRTAHS
jgi:hypothetical protein